MKFILTVIFSFIFLVSGFSQTRNVVVGTNDVIVQPTNFWSANASNGRTGLGLGTAATNPASAFQPSSSVLSNLASSNGSSLTNISVSNVVGALTTNGSAAALTNFPSSLLTTNGNATNLTNFPTSLLRTNGNGFGLTNLNASNITGIIPASNISTLNLTNIGGTLAIASGGTGATNADGARTNLGIGATWLTNTNVTNFRTAIGLGATNEVQFGKVFVNGVFEAASNRVEVFQPILIADRDSTNDVFQFETGTDRAIARTNLGLGWSALTNSNAGTGLVSVNTNGEVVSPTNFWQVSPANTRVQLSQPVVNATNNATNARNLYLYSLAISTTGITNTIQLPTNGGTLLGDVATIIHEGPTSSITAIRQIGAGTNIITLNQFQEAVKFIYESNGWRLADNVSYVEPIYFSGTNASANAAASRTNLGLGATWLTNNNVTNFRTEIGLGATNDVEFLTVDTDVLKWEGANVFELETFTFYGGLTFNNTTNAAITRTNLGLGFSALTNTSVTNFQKAIFYTNTAPSNIGGNLGTIAAWIEIVASNGVTYKVPAYTNVP